MRVLVLHSRYLSGAVSGENRVVEDELRALREAGHDIRDWQPSISADASRVAMAVDAIWSRSATSEVARLVREHRPDVVHVHSLYPRLSPAILRALPRRQPTVMTLHNFRLMCLPATYLRDGSICEACANRTPWRGVVHACYRGSRSASGALATSLVLHRSLATFSRIDRFLAVSNFVRDKYVDVGFEPSRVRVKFNFAWPSERRGDAGGPLLFLGRIAPEKGLDVLLRAKPDELELVVAGGGDERIRLEPQSVPGVTFLGEVDPSEVPRLIRRARALVVPSQWYEGQPRVILEAFAAGVPVLASRIGGLPELVEDDFNGYLVTPRDEDGWRAAMENVADPEQSRRLGHGAYATWEARFTAAIGLRELEAAYEEAIAAAQSGRPNP